MPASQGRVVSVLEGGYDLEGLSKSAAAHVSRLMRGGMTPMLATPADNVMPRSKPHNEFGRPQMADERTTPM